MPLSTSVAPSSSFPRHHSENACLILDCTYCVSCMSKGSHFSFDNLGKVFASEVHLSFSPSNLSAAKHHIAAASNRLSSSFFKVHPSSTHNITNVNYATITTTLDQLNYFKLIPVSVKKNSRISYNFPAY